MSKKLMRWKHNPIKDLKNNRNSFAANSRKFPKWQLICNNPIHAHMIISEMKAGYDCDKFLC